MSTVVVESLQARWSDLTSWMIPEIREKWWNKIYSSYTESHRHYHTVNHIAQMFDQYDTHKDVLQNRVVVAYAIFFHDLVYNPKSAVNEDESAKEFQAFCSDTTIDDSTLVIDLISATKGHCTDAHFSTDVIGTEDVHYFLDFDMVILGSEPEAYDKYCLDIRKEYGHLEDSAFQQERLKLLKLFLQIPCIYATSTFREKYEAKARNNIKREIDQLSA